MMHWIRFHIPIRGIGMPGGAPPHPDHLWVTDTLIERLDLDTVILYDDLPYAWAEARRSPSVNSLACSAAKHIVPTHRST